MVDVKLIVNNLLPAMTMVVSPDVYALFAKCPEKAESILKNDYWFKNQDAPANIGTAGHQPTDQSKAQG